MMLRRGCPWRACLVPVLLAALLFPLSAGAAGIRDGKTSWVERYRQALAIDPDNASLRYQLGLSLLAAGENEAAVAELHRAYPSLSQTIGINFNMGLAYTRLRDPDSALLYLEQAEAGGALEQPEIYPLASAFYNVALVQLDDGEQDAAIETLGHVVELAPERRDLMRLYGDVLFRAGRTAEAQQQLLRYLSLYPDDGEVRETLFALHYNRGLELLEAHKTDDAYHAFERALAVVPESPMALYYLGYLDYQQKRYAAVVRRLAPQIAQFPEDIQRSSFPLLYNASLGLLAVNDAALAAEGMASLTGPGCTEVRYLALAGRAALTGGDYAAARGFYARVLELEPAHAEALGNLVVVEQALARELVDEGQKLFRAGELLPAYRLFVEAQGLNPLDQKLMAYLKETTRQLEQASSAEFERAAEAEAAGELIPALKLVRKGLELWPDAPQGRAFEARLLDGLELELARQLLEAQSLLALGELPRAEAAFAMLLEIDPRNDDAQNGLQAARSALERLVEERLAQGGAALENGDLDGAASAFAAVLQQRPERPEALEGMQRIEALREAMIGDELQWARRAYGEGDYAAAREHFQNVLGRYDTPPLRNEYLAFETAAEKRLAGLLKAARGARADHDFRRALGHYQDARGVAADPGSLDDEYEATLREADEIMVNLLVQARAALESGEAGRSVQLLRAVLKIEPSQAQALEMLTAARTAAGAAARALVDKGMALQQQGELSAARSAFLAALDADPYVKGAQQALDLLDLQARKLNEAQVERLYLEGVAFYTRGDYLQAIGLWRQVLEIEKGHEKARRNLDKAERKLKQLKEHG